MTAGGVALSSCFSGQGTVNYTAVNGPVLVHELDSSELLKNKNKIKSWGGRKERDLGKRKMDPCFLVCWCVPFQVKELAVLTLKGWELLETESYFRSITR